MLPILTKGFNPRPRMGGDRGRTLGQSEDIKFQSTPPHGVRPFPETFLYTPSRFNPRPRMGGDLTFFVTLFYSTCFNPRPRMGGDLA